MICCGQPALFYSCLHSFADHLCKKSVSGVSLAQTTPHQMPCGSPLKPDEHLLVQRSFSYHDASTRNKEPLRRTLFTGLLASPYTSQSL
ncbi:hypothetical protein CDAR_314251 [Caerostris darwini]|uniref:Uncharacterized protein n=1 Tax=Caerostris darwini TaxID=1538125 RepID=A0AAV4U7D3_9ARAC|nr:hypothetical protein CDAR_314251 [Caerostris darwini]